MGQRANFVPAQARELFRERYGSRPLSNYLLHVSLSPGTKLLLKSVVLP